MANEVRIEMIGDESDLVTAAKNADKSLDQINGSMAKNTDATRKTSMSVTDFHSAYMIAMDVMRAGQAVWEQTAAVTLKYDESIRKLAEVSGTGAEEASRLIQVLDDFKISADDVFTATKAMTKEGLSPTIETLAQLSDEYNTLNPGQERAAFLMENFGKSGLKFAEAMNKGGDALRNMGQEVEAGLIRTDAQIAKTRLAELQFDKWADKVEALKVTLGAGFIGILDGSTVAIEDSAQAIWKQTHAFEVDVQHMGRYTKEEQAAWEEAKKLATEQYLLANGIDLAGEAAEKAAGGLETEEEAMVRLEEEAKAAAEALSAMTAVNEDMLSLTMSISDEMTDYNTKLAETIAEYGAASEEVMALKDAHAEAMMQIAVDLELAKLKADGLTDAEYQMALALMESTGQLDSAAAQTAANLDLIASAAQNAGTAGMDAFGAIMSTVLADGVIDSAELQDALNLLNAEAPSEAVVGLQTVFENATAAGVSGTDQMQSGLDSISTSKAVSNIDALTAALYKIPTEININVNYTTTGEPPPGIVMSDYGFSQL